MKPIVLILIGYLLGYLVFNVGCNFIFGSRGCVADIKNAKYDTLQHTIDTVYQKHDSIIYKRGKDINHDTTIYVNIPIEVLQQVDTAALLKDYFAINVYKDTIVFKDSLGWASIIDSVQKNTLINRVWEYNVVTKTIKENTILREKLKNHLYLGITSGGPGVLYTTKNNFAFNLSTNGKKANFGVFYKIK